MRRVKRIRQRIEPFERHRAYLSHKGRHIAQFRPLGAIAARLVAKHPYPIERELREAWAVLGPSILSEPGGKQSWGYAQYGEPR